MSSVSKLETPHRRIFPLARKASNASTDYLCAADFPLPGLVAPGSVVPSAVPLAVPALGVIPDEKPVWGDAPAPGLLLAREALEFVRVAEPS